MFKKRVTLPLRSVLWPALLALCACGGGGGGDNSTPAPVPPAPPAITKAQLNDASRFSAMATFGLDYEQIEALALQGKAEWFDEQLALPVGYHTPIVDELMAREADGEFDPFDPEDDYPFLFRRWAWWHQAVRAPDALRQRVAFALSEIFVASDNVDTLLIFPYALTTYYDILLQHSLGNYRDLLREVTLSPAMGVYLSHLNNARSDASLNRFPDENYAREVMQLFSIGLYELNDDGTRQRDANGELIPTYDNDDIREFAKVFTGLTFGGGGPNEFPNAAVNFREPMNMVEFAHEPGEKRLLRGTVIPAGLPAQEDLEMAIDNLFEHPNVGPFIGRQLIQRLVTSNPSAAYVQRVAAAFANNGQGVRGDLAAVVRAVLFDPEATAAPNPSGTFGKLREPVERNVAMLRQFSARSDSDDIYNSGLFLQLLTGQHPMSAFSVFSFFSPEHIPNGELLDLGLQAPEFEITNSSTIVGMSNLIDFAVSSDVATDLPEPLDPVTLDFSEYLALANDLDALIDRLDTVLTAGQLSASSRAAIRSAIQPLDDADFIVRTAVYLFLISPDYSVRI
jgi:uncharacterized protein (DUF1800 family)